MPKDSLSSKDIEKEIKTIKESPRYKDLRNSDIKKKLRIKRFLRSLKSEDIENYIFSKNCLIKEYPITWMKFSQSIEHLYYIVLQLMQDDFGMKVEKTLDTFTGSEISGVTGQLGNKQGIMQDRISNLIKSIAVLSREMFPILRNIRLLDERLKFYKDYYEMNDEWQTADLQLKNIWNTFVLGGAQSPSSVYGMAQQLQFTTLPTLFFNIAKPAGQSVNEFMETFGYKSKNPQYSRFLLNALAEKTSAFYNWLDNSFKELITRRKFLIQDLRRHYNVLKLNINWLIPYLKIERRSQNRTEKLDRADILSFVDQMLLEMEVVGKVASPDKKKTDPNVRAKNYYMVAHFEFRTRPQFQQQGAQGPSVTHLGRTEVQFKLYEWTAEQFEAYKLLNDIKNMEIVGDIVDSLYDIFDNYRVELEAYLGSKGEDLDIPGDPYLTEDEILEKQGIKSKSKDKKEEKKQDNILTPFLGVVKGGYEMMNILTFNAFQPSNFKGLFESVSGKKQDEEAKAEITKNKHKGAQSAAKKKSFGTFNKITEIYKKQLGLLAWKEKIMRD